MLSSETHWADVSFATLAISVLNRTTASFKCHFADCWDFCWSDRRDLAVDKNTRHKIAQKLCGLLINQSAPSIFHDLLNQSNCLLTFQQIWQRSRYFTVQVKSAKQLWTTLDRPCYLYAWISTQDPVVAEMYCFNPSPRFWKTKWMDFRN